MMKPPVTGSLVCSPEYTSESSEQTTMVFPNTRREYLPTSSYAVTQHYVLQTSI